MSDSGGNEQYDFQKNPLPDRKAKIMHSYIMNNPSIVEKGVRL